MESIYISSFLMGLLGGTHCAGMCGGIVLALSMGISEPQRRDSPTMTLYLLLYNGGRLISYILAGFIVAGFGSAIEMMGDGMIVRRGFALIAAVMMILLGFYLTGWWLEAIQKIEQLGLVIWKLIEPYARKFVPVRTPGQAFVAGVLWGWLPCGLVYTALIWALSAENIVQGGLVMASFGIGTLPTMLGIGFFAGTATRYLQQHWVRVAAGVTVMCFGIVQLIL